MVKKKISGQTIAIIVLAILLICAIVFGGVYAFYSTSTKKAVSGRIVMANLDIEFKMDDPSTPEYEGLVGVGGASQILISCSDKVVPNQELSNTPLTITNTSNTPIYLVVLYRVERIEYDEEKGPLDVIYRYNDVNENGVYDKGVDNIRENNGVKQFFNVLDIGTSQNVQWTNFVFDTTNYPEYKTDETDANDNDYIVRCLVSTEPVTENIKEAIVIAKDELKLHKDVGNEFQSSELAFTFQAHAIGSESFQFGQNTTNNQKCDEILKAIYKTSGWKFNV